MLNKKPIIIAVTTVIAVGIYALTHVVFAGRPVDAVHPKRGTAIEAVYATGTVEPVYWAKLTSPIGGRIVNIIKDEGEWVEEGDVIAHLDDREQLAEIERLKANGAMLASEMRRQQALIRRNITTARNYEQTLADYRQNQAVIDAAQKRLSDMQIIAPMKGQVLRRLVDEGEFIKAGDPAFWVGKPQPLQVIAEIDEEDIPKVLLNQIALVRADAYMDRVIDGSVFKIIPKGDPINKVFLAEVVVPDNSGLLIGMTVEVNIVVSKHENALLVPVNSLLEGKVWVIDHGKTVHKAVVPGIIGDKTAEITTGLSESDMVLSPVPDDVKENQSADPNLKAF